MVLNVGLHRGIVQGLTWDLSCFYHFLWQCLKLRFYFVHTSGAQVAKIVHPAVCRCVLPYIKVFIFKKMHTHTGCTGSKICAPRVQGAPLISNTVWLCMICIVGEIIKI